MFGCSCHICRCISVSGFEAEDDDNYDMIQHFESAWKFIESARKTGGKVLVHCIMGINRSGLITTCYTIRHKKVGPIEASKFVKKARGMILTNETFQRQAVRFAYKEGLLLQERL